MIDQKFFKDINDIVKRSHLDKKDLDMKVKEIAEKNNDDYGSVPNLVF